MHALLLAASCLIAQPGEKVAIFDGKSLDGWVAEGAKDYKVGDQLKNVWSVKDGVILCEGKGFGFLRYDKKEFADFVFHVEYKQAPKCNSGLGIRTTKFDPKQSTATRPSFYSYEIQLVDDAGKEPNAHSTGSLYRYVAPAENANKPAGEWNEMEIECRGPLIKITHNGKKIIDVDQSKIEAIANKPTRGYVCVQNHGGTIEFRNLWVREIVSENK